MGRNIDTAHAAGLLVISAVILLGITRAGFAGVNVRIGT